MPPSFSRRAITAVDAQPGQKAFAFDPTHGGRTFAAEVVQLEGESADFLVLEATAWEVDAAGNPVLLNGAPVRTPAQRISVHLDALATGTMTVAVAIAQAEAGLAERLLRIRSQLDIVAAIPKRGAPRPGGPK
ncbi:MAG: hypothetical protein H0X64_10705 [Gemmatimonadaceae bacterium]|nr:hypothetical protein [Gemmatimonadaceae bacterium]